LTTPLIGWELKCPAAAPPKVTATFAKGTAIEMAATRQGILMFMGTSVKNNGKSVPTAQRLPTLTLTGKLPP
jgi:hypothetical protein